MLKEDLISKNLDSWNITSKECLAKEIVFKYSFKTKDNRVNWIVQLPGQACRQLLKNNRIFMSWRTYRIREFVNILRCYKCHSYEHIAKVCNISKQICMHCGKDDHERTDCPSKNEPRCSNCIRSKRKDPAHAVRSPLCPEYLRQVEIYNKKNRMGLNIAQINAQRSAAAAAGNYEESKPRYIVYSGALCI
ncbi:hypothetical protein KPH14_001036 [Odynerus spinipes]|uniref:CCHC-type domain-containing protein n=1 Tax=Odynerus spinipes TaxID=1348599 RepID=A0AAD9R9V7_9HYME|nr:hypothetical protein KPH14_001036 [Odynerus spinipes]